MSVESTLQGLLSPRLIMVPCLFHFILLPTASHMAKPKVKGWEIHSAPLVGRIARSMAKGRGTGRGRELVLIMQSSTVIIVQEINFNKIKLDIAT